ncbi:MAG TPA: dihydrodipicolinate synthase family protein [Pyrinomonadaceae bacterium]
MTINLSGVLLPITTPFMANEDVDIAALKANINRWNTTGIAGYVVLGSTGERVNLDEREYLQLIETTRAAVPESMTFIAGAGQQSTRGTIAEIESAAKAGAEAALVITPHFYRPAITQQTLFEYYSAVADGVSIPVVLYSMPDLTGIKIEPETAARLSEHPNIIGIKDSSNDVAKLRETVQMTAEDFTVVIGNGTVFYEALQAGAIGGILAVGCVVPALCLQIYRAVKAGENDRATSLQEKLTPLARAVTRTYGVAGLKAAMDMAGYVGGGVRAPLQPATEEARAEIAELLHDVVTVSEARA